jgi:hypothetical protein
MYGSKALTVSPGAITFLISSMDREQLMMQMRRRLIAAWGLPDALMLS